MHIEGSVQEPSRPMSKNYNFEKTAKNDAMLAKRQKPSMSLCVLMWCTLPSWLDVQETSLCASMRIAHKDASCTPWTFFTFFEKMHENVQNYQICHNISCQSEYLSCRSGNALCDRREKWFSPKMSHRWFLHGALDMLSIIATYSLITKWMCIGQL
jgi:hypothetical protein